MNNKEDNLLIAAAILLSGFNGNKNISNGAMSSLFQKSIDTIAEDFWKMHKCLCEKEPK